MNILFSFMFLLLIVEVVKTFCIDETKDADQLRSNYEADHRIWFSL